MFLGAVTKVVGQYHLVGQRCVRADGHDWLGCSKTKEAGTEPLRLPPSVLALDGVEEGEDVAEAAARLVSEGFLAHCTLSMV